MLFSSLAFAEKINWNEAKINWYSYESGLEELKANNANGIILLYADWCPTCQEYSKLFQEKEVLKSLEDIILIKANVDEVEGVEHLIEYNESYVPKTIAIDSEGNVLENIYTEKKKYIFYLHPNNPNELLELVDTVKKLNSE
jgi:thiol:disulfide interchange protein